MKCTPCRCACIPPFSLKPTVESRDLRGCSLAQGELSSQARSLAHGLTWARSREEAGWLGTARE